MSTAITEKPQELAFVQPTIQALSAKQLLDRVQLIKEVKAKVMQKGVHYGTIPGCGPKDTLLKAGADTLCMTFQLVPEYQVTTINLDGGHREHTIKCRLNTVGGQLIAEGVGSCSTLETKYRYLKVEDGTRIERKDIADVYNNTLKMGKKRAYVDATITATGSSDLFTQDIEDFGPEDRQQSTPQRKQAAPQASDAPATQMLNQCDNGDEEWRGTLESIEVMSGRGPKGPWKLYQLHLSGGFKVGTFDKPLADKAARLTGQLVDIGVHAGKKGGTWNLIALDAAVTDPVVTNDYEPGDESQEKIISDEINYGNTN